MFLKLIYPRISAVRHHGAVPERGGEKKITTIIIFVPEITGILINPSDPGGGLSPCVAARCSTAPDNDVILRDAGDLNDSLFG